MITSWLDQLSRLIVGTQPPTNPNLLANGTFDDSSGWSLSRATISDGVLTMIGGANTGSVASHDLMSTISAGSNVRVVLTRSATGPSNLSISVAGSSGSMGLSGNPQSIDISNVSGGNNLEIRAAFGRSGSSALGFTIDDVSVQVLS